MHVWFSPPEFLQEVLARPDKTQYVLGALLHPLGSEQKAALEQAAEHGKEMLALHSKMREVADKVQQVEDDMECSFCMERPASTALVPCGHCFCCKEGCGSKTLSVCPCCQSKFALRLLIETCLCVKSKIPH